MSTIVGQTVADTIYAVDKLADDTLINWFEEHWPDVRLVSEGLDEPVELGRPDWTVIIDSIDGTRGLMYDKRAAWCLVAAAPVDGTLSDIAAAAMTELPTVKQGFSDQLSGVRGVGLSADRLDLMSGARRRLPIQPSSAQDLEHGYGGFAKFFVPGKPALAELENELFARLGAKTVFDDQYVSSGGQIYELITGRDRFIADLRPLVTKDGLACHPYDVCSSLLLVEAGGVITDPWGQPLDTPLDTTTPVAWVGYANQTLAELVEPVLTELLEEFRVG
jgi:hypothetical protein